MYTFIYSFILIRMCIELRLMSLIFLAHLKGIEKKIGEMEKY